MGVATGRVAIRTAGLLLPGARAPAAISSLGHFWETQRKFQCRVLGSIVLCNSQVFLVEEFHLTTSLEARRAKPQALCSGGHLH